MLIDRCICTKQTFAELFAVAESEGLTANELEEQTGAGSQCHLCRPYVRRACRTGQTVFTQLLSEADEPG